MKFFKSWIANSHQKRIITALVFQAGLPHRSDRPRPKAPCLGGVPCLLKVLLKKMKDIKKKTKYIKRKKKKSKERKVLKSKSTIST